MKEPVEESLEHTPTWAVAAVCIVFIALSMLMQRGLQRLGTFLLDSHKKSLYAALKKMKEELMLLGFISLLLTVAQNPMSRLCMPASWAFTMLPCHFSRHAGGSEAAAGPSEGSMKFSPLKHEPQSFPSSSSSSSSSPLGHGRSTLAGIMEIDHDGFFRRHLQSSIPRMLEFSLHDQEEESPIPRKFEKNYCSSGHIPVMSTESLHQLHIFIFVMAVVHVFYSCFTMLFGFTKLRSWRKWEEETQADNYNCTAEIRKSFDEEGFSKMQFRKIGFGSLGRQSSFVTSRTMTPWSTNPYGIWINSFFRQFRKSIAKSDYLTLRYGFIKNHNAPMHLNFHRYIMTSLQDDLKTVIGISGYLWVFVIFFMILNVHGWYAYFWMSFIPVLLNLIIGTKLQHIITQLAMETAHVHGIIGMPIKPRDELFWFNNPHVPLYFIHFILFQNAFELAFCIWLVTTFGFNSCFFDKHGFITARVVVGILAQVLCSYSTLPLYALVSQMGSHYKRAIFADPVSSAMTDWRNKACSRAAKLRHNLSNPDNSHIDNKHHDHNLHHNNDDEHDHKDAHHIIIGDSNDYTASHGHGHLTFYHEHPKDEGKFSSTYPHLQSTSQEHHSNADNMAMAVPKDVGNLGMTLSLPKGSIRSDAATAGSSFSWSRIQSLDCFRDHGPAAAKADGESMEKCPAKCSRITLVAHLNFDEIESKEKPIYEEEEDVEKYFERFAHPETRLKAIHMKISSGETVDGHPHWALECNECKSLSTLTLDAAAAHPNLPAMIAADQELSIMPKEGSTSPQSCCKQSVFLRILNPWSADSHFEPTPHLSQGEVAVHGQEVGISSTIRPSFGLTSLLDVEEVPGNASSVAATLKQHLEYPLASMASGHKANGKSAPAPITRSDSKGKGKTSAQSYISRVGIETVKNMLLCSLDTTLFSKQQQAQSIREEEDPLRVVSTLDRSDSFVTKGPRVAALERSDSIVTKGQRVAASGSIHRQRMMGDGKVFTKSASYSARLPRSSSSMAPDDGDAGRIGDNVVLNELNAKLEYRKSASFATYLF